MEAKSSTCAEVRRLHIVYFLSGKSGIEHPHLIRVHHLCNNGVRLRDMKSWLRELRGNDMPELYSWSYKRRYRTGYVWQDLQDGDLITPISDNEYVLKGSEISSTMNNLGISKASSETEHLNFEEDQTPKSKYQDQSYTYIMNKSSPEIEEEFPVFGSDTSTLTDDPHINLGTPRNIITSGIKQEKLNEKPTSNENIIRYPTKRKNRVKIDEKTTNARPNFSKSKSSSYRSSSNIFKSVITCGAVDTNDSATVMINKSHRPFFNICPTDQKNVHSAEVCKRDCKIVAPHRIYTSPWHQQELSGSTNGAKEYSTKDKNESRCQSKAFGSAYKPINGPNCSQCGKQFKPEKLHAHMKFCKGTKALAKTNGSVAKNIEHRSSTELTNENSVSGYFLTH